MKLLFIGLGSIGRRHARLIREHFPEHELYAMRSGANPEPAPEFKLVRSFFEVRDLKPAAVFITNPTFLHVATALRCAEAGAHLFIEKPLSHTMEGIARLACEITDRNLTAYVAYPLRHLPELANLRGKSPRWTRFVCRTYLPLWRPEKNHLAGYSAYASMGGGALFDLSHEIDLAWHLFGSIDTIHGIHGRRGYVTVDADDFADLILEHTCGTRSYIHLDLAHVGLPERYLETDGGVHVDIRVTDALYLTQLQYFFYNLGNPAMMNSVNGEASQLLRQIVRFAET